MALLSRLAPEFNGKRKREVDGFAGGSLKKLMSSANIRSSLTTFPASLYVGHRSTNGRTAQTALMYGLRSAFQLSGTELYAPELPSRASQAVLQQLSPVFHPESIKSRPEVSKGGTATACSTTPVKWNPLSSYPGKAQGVLPQQARIGNLVACLYRSARIEAEVGRLKEQMHKMARDMVQLQHETEEYREKYSEVVQLAQQSADLRKMATAALAGPSAKKPSRKVWVDDAGAQKEDGGARDGHVHRNSPPVGGVASSSFSVQAQRLHDLKLEDARQKSRDLEIKLKEAELAVQKQHRLKLEEPVRIMLACLSWGFILNRKSYELLASGTRGIIYCFRRLNGVPWVPFNRFLLYDSQSLYPESQQPFRLRADYYNCQLRPLIANILHTCTPIRGAVRQCS
jgi:hypothetical protein